MMYFLSKKKFSELCISGEPIFVKVKRTDVFKWSWKKGKDMQQAEQWKSLSSVQLFVNPLDNTVHGTLQATRLEWVAFPFSKGSSQPRNQTQVCTAGGCFTSWATREAQEYWSGSLSRLQGNFLTQESNQSLLHCRRILYQLSHQGSPAAGCYGLK